MVLLKVLFAYIVVINLNCFAQPWVENNAIWKYRFQEQGLSNAEGLFETHKTGNILKGGKMCDELITKRINFLFDGNQWNPLDTIVIDTNYTYKSISGDTIFWFENLEFRILYDFSKNPGDSWLVSVNSIVSDQNCNDSSYSEVMQKEIIDIGGMGFRKQYIDGIDISQKFRLRGEYNERFGPYGCCISETLEGYIFPIKELNCWNNSLNNIVFTFLCFQDDSLIFDLNCEFYFSGLSEISTYLKVTPNPFESYLNLKTEGSPYKITILSTLGNLIRKFDTVQEFNSTSFENLKDGFYLIEVYFEKNQISRLKILKN